MVLSTAEEKERYIRHAHNRTKITFESCWAIISPIHIFCADLESAESILYL